LNTCFTDLIAPPGKGGNSNGTPHAYQAFKYQKSANR
jgi:hypothetical protein